MADVLALFGEVEFFSLEFHAAVHTLSPGRQYFSLPGFLLFGALFLDIFVHEQPLGCISRASTHGLIELLLVLDVLPLHQRSNELGDLQLLLPICLSDVTRDCLEKRGWNRIWRLLHQSLSVFVSDCHGSVNLILSLDINRGKFRLLKVDLVILDARVLPGFNSAVR